MKAYDKQFIGGEWREGCGEHVLENRNPFTDEVIYTYRSAGKKDVDDAYAAAKKAQKEWYALKPKERVEALEGLLAVMRDYAPIIEEVLLEEAGSPFGKRKDEAKTCANIVRSYLNYPYVLDGKIQVSDKPSQWNYVFRKPKGVITVISPWNAPFLLSAHSFIPAIALGNAVVAKPASDTPASAFVFGEIFEKAGMPAGLYNAVAGAGSDIGDYIVEHPLCDAVAFTGSSDVGKHIGALVTGQCHDVSLELGGNNSMLVLPGADIERAASKAVFGAYFNQGQICMALNRIIVVDDVYDEFCATFAPKVAALNVGDPADPNSFYGPLINHHQVERFDRLVQETIDAGARVLVEGKTEGNLVYPWLLADVTNDMPAAQNEMFGPVASIIRAKDEDEAVAIANDTRYGLSNCVFDRDVYHAMGIARRLESGMVHVNDQSIGDEKHVMFGGEKQSGVGRINGEWAMRMFTSEQWLAVQE